MGLHAVKKNPVRVFSQSVQLRDAKGRFSSYKNATSFIVTIERLKLEFDIPKFRPKTADKVKFFVEEVVAELKSQFYPQEQASEERRKKIPKRRAKKVTDKVQFTLEEKETRYFSKRELKDLQSKDFYFWFKPPYEISTDSAKKIMALVYKFAYQQAVILINKHRLKKWKYRIRILGGGQYERVRAGAKNTQDLFGFSMSRMSVPPSREHLKTDIKYNYDELMRVLLGYSKIGSYFTRISRKHVDKMGRKYVFLVHGIHLEFIREA